MQHRVAFMMRPATYKKMKIALLELLSQKKLNDIDIITLAKQAKIDRSTIHRKVQGTRDEAISLCYNDIVKETIDSLLNSLEPDKIGDFEKMYNQLFNCIEMNAEVLSILLGPNVPPDFDKKLLEIICERYKTNINMLYPDYSFLEKNKKMLDHCATFFANGLLALLKKWLESGCKNRDETLKSINLIDESIEQIFTM